MAQSGSALDWGSRGPEFKSPRPDHFSPPQGGVFRSRSRSRSRSRDDRRVGPPSSSSASGGQGRHRSPRRTRACECIADAAGNASVPAVIAEHSRRLHRLAVAAFSYEGCGPFLLGGVDVIARLGLAITPLGGTSEWVLPARFATSQHPRIAASRRGQGVRSCSRPPAAASHRHGSEPRLSPYLLLSRETRVDRARI